MENPPFEDVFPIQDGDFPLLCLFTRGYCITYSPTVLTGPIVGGYYFLDRFGLDNAFVKEWTEEETFCKEVRKKTSLRRMLHTVLDMYPASNVFCFWRLFGSSKIQQEATHGENKRFIFFCTFCVLYIVFLFPLESQKNMLCP